MRKERRERQRKEIYTVRKIQNDKRLRNIHTTRTREMECMRNREREREREIKRHNDIERSNAEGIEKEIEW